MLTLRQFTALLLWLAIVPVSVPCLAASIEDDFTVGRIDPQIACVPNKVETKATEGKEEPACLAKFHDLVSRVGDNLIFKLDDGKTKTIHGDAKGCQAAPVVSCSVYRLVGYIVSSRQFVLRALGYEDERAWLVSQRSGVVTKLWGYPRLSPSGKQFITVAASEAWNIDDPIEIYSNIEPPRIVWKYPNQPEQEELYTFDGWDGEDHVKLHTTSEPQISTDVSRTADGWTLKRPNDKIYAAPYETGNTVSKGANGKVH